MKPIENKTTNISSILILSCSIYAPLCALINFLCGVSLTATTLLKLWAIVVIFAFTFVIALVIAVTKKINYENLSWYAYCVCIYSILSAALTVYSSIFVGSYIWSLYSLFLVIAYSSIVSLLLSFVKIKSYLISTLMYYAISLAAFMVLTTVIASYNKGNLTMILFGSFSLFYTVCSILYYFVKRSFAQYDNEEKEYKPQFD